MTTSSDAPTPVTQLPFDELETVPERRVWALNHAKRTLNKAPFGGNEPQPTDLIEVAEYILDGSRPPSFIEV